MIENPNVTWNGTVSILDICEARQTYDAVEQRVPNPQPELGTCEERVLLAEHIELRVPVEDTRGHELIEDTDNEGRQEGEHDIVEGKCPRLVGDLPGEVVEERKLQRC